MKTRDCYMCKKTLPLNADFFYPRPIEKDKDGFRRACKECEKAHRRKIYPEQYKNYTIAYNKRRYENPETRAIQLLSSYKYMDKKKGREFDLTASFIIEMFKKPCTYCGETNELKIGLDRKDNSKGHTEKNVTPCCIECNTARSDLFSYEEMLILGATIRVIKQNRLAVE